MSSFVLSVPDEGVTAEELAYMSSYLTYKKKTGHPMKNRSKRAVP